MRLHDPTEELFHHIDNVIQITKGRSLENGYRICIICQMEEKKNRKMKRVRAHSDAHTLT